MRLPAVFHIMSLTGIATRGKVGEPRGWPRSGFYLHCRGAAPTYIAAESGFHIHGRGAFAHAMCMAEIHNFVRKTAFLNGREVLQHRTTLSH